jgi:hypothetical protein
MKGLLLFFAAVLLLGLSGCGDNDTQDQADQEVTPVETVETDDVAEVPPTTDIVYYRFSCADDAVPLPEGSITLLEGPPEEMLALVPENLVVDGQLDPAQSISAGLREVIACEGNEWTSEDLSIASVGLEEGHATVELDGSISGAGGIVLVATRMQILSTIFAEPSVQTATVTLNGECIANLGISHESEARAADYRFTREEVMAF